MFTASISSIKFVLWAQQIYNTIFAKALQMQALLKAERTKKVEAKRINSKY